MLVLERSPVHDTSRRSIPSLQSNWTPPVQPGVAPRWPRIVDVILDAAHAARPGRGD